MTHDDADLPEPFQSLPDLMRGFVVLKYCQALTLQQIGEQPGRGVPALASLLSRPGLEALRNPLKTEE